MSDVEDILLALEKSNMVPSAFVARLRMEITKAPPPHDPKLLVKFLVDKGHITAAQGERLLLAPKTVQSKQPEPEEYINLDEDLGLAPLEGEPDTGSSLPLPPPAPPPPVPAPAPKQFAAAVPTKKPTPAPAAPKPAPGEQVYDLEVVDDAELTEDDVVAEQLEVGSDEDEILVSKRARRRSVWDSPLLVLGGGGLALLLILVGALVWSILRTSGEEAFALAETDYKNGAYSQAIAKIDDYLRNYSRHKDVSRARVMRGLAQIRQHAEGSRNWPIALDTAREKLGEISGEEAFPQFRAELAGLLPDIAAGLASQAAEKPDDRLITETNEALLLVKQYVPAAIRNEDRLNAVADSLDVTRRTLALEAKLAATVEQVNAVAERLAQASAEQIPGQLETAYDARRELLKEYPNLADEPRLATAMKRVSQAEVGAVTPLSLSRDATTDEATTTARATLALASRELAPAGTIAGAHTFLVNVPGGLVGLNSATGEPKWRREVGPDFYVPPLYLSGAHEGDALVADTPRRELLRIDAATGALRWRQTFEETFSAAPVVLGNEALLATHSGKLYRVELATGRVIGGWQLPQSLDTAPTVDPRRNLVYQLGSQANLYVLAADAPVCREVCYLGHEPGSVLVSPTAVSQYLVLGENVGLKDGQLRVIATDQNGLQLAVRQVESIGGHVDTPLLVDGRRLHAVTDRGGVYTFEINPPGQGKPLTPFAQRAATLEEPLTHFALAKGGRIWVGGTELSRYGIQSTSAKLAPDGVTLRQSVFLRPLEADGNSLLLVCRARDGWGATARAVSAAGRETIWETRLGLPSLGGVQLASDGKTMMLLDAAGSVFRLTPADLARGGMTLATGAVRPWPEAIPPALLDAAPLALDDGSHIWAVEDNASRLLQVAPDGSIRWIAAPEPLTSAPVSFRYGVAFTGQEGRVYVIDPAKEGNLLEPYQPRVTVDKSPRRFGPVAVDGDHLLTGDDEGKLTLLVVKGDPKPHLEVEREVSVAEPIAGAPVVLGQTAFAVTARDALGTFQLPALEQGLSFPLGGKPVWGPGRVGDFVMVATTANELMCCNAQGELAWTLPMSHGPLAGPPIFKDGELLLFTRNGVVIRVGADGAELAHVETGLSLQGAGAIVGQHLIAPGGGGALHVIPLP